MDHPRKSTSFRSNGGYQRVDQPHHSADYTGRCGTGAVSLERPCQWTPETFTRNVSSAIDSWRIDGPGWCDGIEYRCYFLGDSAVFGGFSCDRNRIKEPVCKILFVVSPSLASESDLSWPDWQKEPRHWHRHRITWKAGYLNQPWDEGIIISKILSSMISLLPGNPYNNFCTRK